MWSGARIQRPTHITYDKNEEIKFDRSSTRVTRPRRSYYRDQEGWNKQTSICCNYTVEFKRIGRARVTDVATHGGIYVDMLHDLIETTTGLYTRL
jgi:hypothetical protein